MEEIIFRQPNTFKDKLRRHIDKIKASFKSGNFIKRIINYYLVKISLLIKSPKVLGYPFYLMIEPTNICNLKCPLCPTGEETLERKKVVMDFSILKMAIDELGDYILELNITNYGEPFIHKELCEMISYVKRKGIKVSVGSNGHYFNDEASVEKLILSGVDEIYVSLDGTSQESYSKYRVSGNFKKVVEGLELLLDLRKRLNSKLPFVELQFLVMQHNEDQIPGIRKLAQDIGVDKLILKPVSFNVSEWNDQGVQERFKDFMPKNEYFRLYRLVGEKLEWKLPIENKCDYLWRGTVILCDGTIVPCCLDPRGDYKMGDVKDGIKRVWNSSRYINLRRQILQDKKKLSLCSHCPGT